MSRVRANGQRVQLTMTLQVGALVVVSVMTVALAGYACSSTAAQGTIEGASQAVCAPVACKAAEEVTSYSLSNVENGDGTTTTREYGVFRPLNLKPSPTNRAPAVLVFYQGGDCGLKPTGRFASLAPSERFVVVYMEVPCGRDNNWDKRNVDLASSDALNDEPYVTAVVQAITECPGTGAAANQCIDPQRVYAAGASSGGNMVADVICDAHNSPLFRGYLVDSSSLQLFGGSPSCPSGNRSFFAMMALSNYSIDSEIYNDEDTNPHFDAPAFADWAASRLGCSAQRVDDAVGFPTASTLRYSYAGPCAYATAGSTAVVTLGVQGGGHTWTCQDSDDGAKPYECPDEGLDPPPLTADGRPETNGLFIERTFWEFVAHGVSFEAPAAPLSNTSAPRVSLDSPSDGSTVSGTVSVEVSVDGGAGLARVWLQLDGEYLAASGTGAGGVYTFTWNTADVPEGSHLLRVLVTDTAGNLSTATAHVTVTRPASGASAPITRGGASSLLTDQVGSLSSIPQSPQAPSLVALGDGYASGDGELHYLAGTDTTRDRCHRSSVSYPYIASFQIAGGPSRLHFGACAGARIADFDRSNPRDHEPAQLSLVSHGAREVLVSIGRQDALLAEALHSCVLRPSHCERRWRRRGARAVASLRPQALALFRRIAKRAPSAHVLVVGYPRLFPARPPRRCGADPTGAGLARSDMRWLDSYVQDLDESLAHAAEHARVEYLGASYGAFTGHELCTRRAFLTDSSQMRRTGGRRTGFTPNSRGQATFARLVETALDSNDPN